MLKPKYLEQLPEPMVALYSQAEQDILADMARRISTYEYWIPAANWQYQKLIEMGNFHSYVLKALSARTGKTTAELEQLMKEAGAETLAFDTAIYQAHGLDPPPLAESKALQGVLREGLQKTKGVFQNLTGTTAGTVTKQFENALDRAWLQISSGAFDANAAIRTAIKDLCRQGVGAVTYPTGHVDSIEVAVRRAAVTGVNQTALKLQETLADEMGCDLVETTAHAGARHDHAVWQGQVFSRSGRSKKYSDFVSATGYGSGAGLGGWNCRHSFFPYFEGSPRAYTPSMLKQFEAKNYAYNGQKMTEYEASQTQRYHERQIRRWKRENLAMKAAGLDTSESAAKIKQWQDAQKDFLKQTGLKRQRDREQAFDFGPKEIARTEKMLRVQSLAKERTTAYNKAIFEAKKEIQSDAYPKKLNIGNQNKHIVGSSGYIEGRSYIYGDLETAQNLIDKHSGTGIPRLDRKYQWVHKEYVQTDSAIGCVVDQNTLEATETRSMLIHYGKKGTHIVPTKEAIEK